MGASSEGPQAALNKLSAAQGLVVRRVEAKWWHWHYERESCWLDIERLRSHLAGEWPLLAHRASTRQQLCGGCGRARAAATAGYVCACETGCPVHLGRNVKCTCRGGAQVKGGHSWWHSGSTEGSRTGLWRTTFPATRSTTERSLGKGSQDKTLRRASTDTAEHRHKQQDHHYDNLPLAAVTFSFSTLPNSLPLSPLPRAQQPKPSQVVNP